MTRIQVNRVHTMQVESQCIYPWYTVDSLWVSAMPADTATLVQRCPGTVADWWVVNLI